MTPMTRSHQHVPEPLAPRDHHDEVIYRFDSPEPIDTFVVTRFQAVEALNVPYRLTVDLRAEDEHADAHALLGQDVAVYLAAGSAQRTFRGIVDRVSADRDSNVKSTCRLTVVPALSALGRTRNSRIFQDQSALEIVERVLSEALGPYGRTFRAEAVDRARLVTRDYCVQYRETNLDFVHRLLEEEGIGYCFDQETEPETLVLFDDNRGLPGSATNPVHYRAGSSEGSVFEHVIQMAETSARTSTRLTTRDYDWRLGSRGELEAESAAEPADARRAHEVYEHGIDRHHVLHEDTNMLLGMMEALAAAAIGARLPAPLADRVFDLRGAVFDRFSESNTEDRARVRGDWLRRDARVFEGTSFVAHLAAGTAFELLGHPRLTVDGEYFVTRITHSSEPPPAESGEGTRGTRYHNRFECLPRSTPWRPDRVTPKPVIAGIQTATVTGPPGLDVYTDPHGRVRVRFPWDRAPIDLSGHSTCWLRVGQAWAGSTAPAFLFTPRVGMEVLVSFIEGDPDRPLVTGCVYNGDNATPAMLPAQATKSVIRTRSVPMGTGYNELSFEDAIGFERVYLRAERDLTELVQNHHEVHVHGDENIEIGGAQTEIIRVDREQHIGRNYERSVRGHALETTMGDHTRAVGGSLEEQVEQSYRLEAGGGISTGARGEWSTFARRGITLGSGSSTLRMTDEEQLKGHDNDKGLTLASFGSMVHLSQDKIELTVGDARIGIAPDKIEVTLGGSTLVVSAEMIQANGKTLPVEGG